MNLIATHFDMMALEMFDYSLHLIPTKLFHSRNSLHLSELYHRSLYYFSKNKKIVQSDAVLQDYSDFFDFRPFPKFN